MKTAKKILICGGGIAGPACAYWLHKYGYSVVIAEKARTLRDGGQNVDVKGPGQQVIKMMGLAEKIEAKNTLEQGQKYIDAAGKVVAVLPKGAFGTLTSDFEILRGDFAQVLFEATKDTCEYRFGTFVTNLQETSKGISVTFDNGKVEDFELVICAEGISSSTRKLILAEQTHLRYLGAYMAFFNIPRRPEDDNWAHTINGVGGTFITLRPGTDKVTTVLMTFLRKDHDISGDKPAARKQLLLDALKGRGTVADRVSAELDTVQDFYFGPMSQVQASTWSKGRFVLLGDAAHCPTPFTGTGTALALVGAYVLAGEIKRSADHVEAFGTYERLLRPYVEATQKQLNPRFIRLMHVKTWFGISIARLAQKLLASKVVQKLFKPSAAKRVKDATRDFVLPSYSIDKSQNDCAMSASDKATEAPSPKAGDGGMTRLVKKMYLRDGHIAAVEKLSEHFRLVSLKSEGLKNVEWTPGDKVQISLEGFAARTYTPIMWDPKTGEAQLLAYVDSDAPGSRWAREARIGDAVRFLGPRGSLDLSGISSPILFGDETCFGLAAALRNTAGGKNAPCVFEVNDPKESAIALAAVGISDAVLIERMPGESHLSAVHAELLKTARSDTQFVLAGKAPSIQSVRRALTAAGIGNKRMKAKAYWAPGKTGLD